MKLDQLLRISKKSRSKTARSNLLFDNEISDLLLLVSNPRSGSTWFADSIVCHPFIEYHAKADYYQFFNMLHSRRYPMDLTIGSKEGIEIEINVKKELETIPDFTAKCGLGFFRDQNFNTIHFEKIHPKFAGFDFNSFMSSISELRKSGKKVHIIILNRNPKDSIKSFLNYQLRNKHWHAHLNPDEVVDYFVNTYEFLYKVGKSESVYSVDYKDIKTQYNTILKKVFDKVFGFDASMNVLNSVVVKKAQSLTNREEVAKQNNLFFGKEEGVYQEEVNQLFELLSKKQGDKIKKCYQYYNH